MTFYKETDFQDFIIGRISEDWNIERLQDVLVLLKNGLTVKQNKEGNGYPITRIETISQERIDSDRIGYSPEISERDVEEYKLIKGDILFSHINSLAHIGKTALYEGTPELLLHGMNLLLLRPNKEKIHPEYLLYILKLLKIRNVFWSMSKKAVNQASINQTELGRLRIPVPSVEEQRAVVGVLGVVDSAIGLVDKVIWKTERLKKGLMQTLLTKGIGHTEYKDTPIGKTPIEWKLEKIRDVCEVVTGGTPSTKHPEYFGGNIKWLKSGDIKQLYIYDTTEKITQLGIENSNAKIHPTDSVAIALSGRGQTRGRTTIIKVPMACSQSVAFMIPSSEIVAEYLHYNLSNRYMEIRNLTGHLDRSGLNLSIVSEIQIPVPSLTEQQKIVSILVTVDNKLDLERKEKDKLERLKRGLMGLLLTGKVRIKVD